MIKAILAILQFTNVYSQYIDTMPPIRQGIRPGGDMNTHGCIVSAGYNWCESSQMCLRQWETPCSDNYNDCSDCLKRQRKGENIACPLDCNIIVDPAAISPMPPTPVPIHPTDPIYNICPDVMCMMYCENGHEIDAYGCQMCQCIENVEIAQPACDNLYVCPKVTEMYTDKLGYTTYRLSLQIQPNMNIRNIYAIYGDGNGNGKYQMYIPGAYQVDDNFGSNIGGVSQNIIDINPESKYDSWLTINTVDGDPNNLLSTIGIDFSDWSEETGISIDNGAVFLIDPQINMIDECVIGQLTIRNDKSDEMLINVQGKYLNNIQTWTEDKIVFRFNLQNNGIPNDCTVWYDGCNTCVVNNGVLGGCTRLMCFTEDAPECRTYITSGH